MDRPRISLLSILSGIAFAIVGGAVGLAVFVGIVKRTNWFDGPGGGLALIPLVIVGVSVGISVWAVLLARQNQKAKQ